MIIYFAVPLVALLEGGILGNSKISIKGRNINIMSKYIIKKGKKRTRAKQ